MFPLLILFKNIKVLLFKMRRGVHTQPVSISFSFWFSSDTCQKVSQEVLPGVHMSVSESQLGTDPVSDPERPQTQCGEESVRQGSASPWAASGLRGQGQFTEGYLK